MTQDIESLSGHKLGPGTLTLSTPFWLMKGQSRKAQVVIVGTTLALLVAIGYLATFVSRASDVPRS